MVWLDGLNFGLADSAGEVLDLIEAGRRLSDPEVQRAARSALERYDSVWDEWDSRANTRPDCQEMTKEWGIFYEYLREVLK